MLHLPLLNFIPRVTGVRIYMKRLAPGLFVNSACLYLCDLNIPVQPTKKTMFFSNECKFGDFIDTRIALFAMHNIHYYTFSLYLLLFIYLFIQFFVDFFFAQSIYRFDCTLCILVYSFVRKSPLIWFHKLRT